MRHEATGQATTGTDHFDSSRPLGREASLALVDEYLRTLSPLSQYNFVRAVSCFLDWLAARDVELPQVTAPLAEEYLGGLDVASSTRDQYRGMLRRFFAALLARGAVTANPLLPLCHGGVPAASDTEALEKPFAAFTPVERQATVDAAAWCLLMHDIHAFTDGKGGHPADIDRCERAIALGEKKYGITPLGWLGPEHD